MGSELYKTLHLLKFSPLVDVQGSLQVPRGQLTARIKPSAGQCPKCAYSHPAPL